MDPASVPMNTNFCPELKGMKVVNFSFWYSETSSLIVLSMEVMKFSTVSSWSSIQENESADTENTGVGMSGKQWFALGRLAPLI